MISDNNWQSKLYEGYDSLTKKFKEFKPVHGL